MARSALAQSWAASRSHAGAVDSAPRFVGSRRVPVSRLMAAILIVGLVGALFTPAATAAASGFTPTTISSVGEEPSGVAVSPDGGTVYVTNFQDDSISVIDTTDNSVSSTIRSVGDGPYGIAVAPSGDYLYVSLYLEDKLRVIRTSDNALLEDPSVGVKPYGVAVSPDGSTVYVANLFGSSVSVVSTSSNTVTHTISTDSSPHGLAVSPDGSKLYITMRVASGSVRVVNTSTRNEEANIAVGSNPTQIALAPDGAKAYVTNYGDDSVSVITTSDNSVSTVTEVGSGPFGVAVSPDGATAYIAVRDADRVVTLSTSSGAVTGQIAVAEGSLPVSIAPLPDGTGVFVANYGGDTVSRLDATPSDDSSLSGLALSEGTLSPSFASGTTSYSASVANSVNSITVTPTTSDAGSSVTVNGGSVASGAASSAVALSVGSNTVNVVVTAADSSTTTYTVTVTRAGAVSSGGESGDSSGSSSSEATVSASEVPPVAARRTVVRPDPGPEVTPVSEPVDFGGPEGGVRALVGGIETPLRVTEGGPDKWSIDVGGFGVEVDSPGGDAGEARDSDHLGQKALEIPRGRVAQMRGSGALPGSLVQVWLAGRPGESREIGRVRVADDGGYSYQLSPDAGSSDSPAAIGRQILQLVGVNDEGLQTVIDIPIVIAQGVPTPEMNRITGELPDLSAGMALGTSGGLPEAISIVGFPDDGVVAVQGTQWSFSVRTDSQSGSVENLADGALLRFERGSVALATGSGFVPGTVATVWLFSDPTLMTSIVVADDGSFSSEFLVDASVISPGSHTLQVQGVGSDGFIKAANLGVLVEEPVEVTTENASGLLWWVIGAFLLAVVLIVVLLARSRRNA